MKIHSLFSTPVWHIEKELPLGVYDWALEYEKNNKRRNLSNRGGYQSEPFPITSTPFGNYINNSLSFISDYNLSDAWLNINRNHDYNETHCHPESDLAFIWYITDNDDKLGLMNPHAFTRSKLINIPNQIGSTEMPIEIVADVIYPRCTAGDMLIFPADLLHSVLPTHKPEPRISISFNISLS